MTNTQYRALEEKRFNCIRSIEVATKGLQTACTTAKSRQGKAAAMKSIQERVGRLVILAEQLAILNEQIEGVAA